jgi:hypothetical protein
VSKLFLKAQHGGPLGARAACFTGANEKQAGFLWRFSGNERGVYRYTLPI